MRFKRAHCLFEQSGTFKNEFKKLGVPAWDYDILDDFGQTDYQIDLFTEIDKAYMGQMSIFDTFDQDDVVLAFFPCIRFEDQIQLQFRGTCWSQKNWSLEQKLEYDIKLQRELSNIYIYMQACHCHYTQGAKTNDREPIFNDSLFSEILVHSVNA